MPTDRSGLQILSYSACMELLASDPVRVGRVAVVEEGRPYIFPVNYRLDGDTVIVRTHEGSKLYTAIAGSEVAFEADQMDPAFREGWSVVVRGQVEEITDPDELRHVRALPLRPWAPNEKDRYLRIRTHAVTGRQVA